MNEHKNDLTFESEVKSTIGIHMRKAARDGESFTIVESIGALEAVKLEIANDHDEVDPNYFETPFAFDVARVVFSHQNYVNKESMIGVITMCQLDIGISVFARPTGVDKLANHIASPIIGG